MTELRYLQLMRLEWVERIALFSALMSTVTCVPLSSFGPRTGLEIHWTGPGPLMNGM